MKKILSSVLVVALILTALVSLAIPASAEGEEGAWKVLLSEDSEKIAEEKRPPIPGYYYDESGFHTKAPNYKNFNPKFTVVSSSMLNIENFSMTVVLHDYSVSGDNWLGFTIWSDSNGFAFGDTSGEYGDGWTSVIRAKEDGKLNRLESWNQTKGKRSGKQVCTPISDSQRNPMIFEPCVDAETGDITVTFAITDGRVSVNGMYLGEETDKIISERFKEDLAYVGVTVHNTDSSGEKNPSLSIIEVNGAIPEGSDSREPEAKVREFGPMQDPDTVPEYTPAVWFDGTLEKTNDTLPADARYCEVSFSDDNQNYFITVENNIFYLQLDIPDAISYDAKDFTYFAAIFKNYCTCNLAEGQTSAEYCNGTSESLHIRYCAGNVTSPNDDCIQKVTSFYNVTPISDDMSDCYTVAILKIEHAEWQGRMNAIRLDFGNFESFVGTEDRNTFEIMSVGMFKSGADVTGFVQDFRNLNLYTDLLEYDYPLEEILCSHLDIDGDGNCEYCGEPIENSSDETDTGEGSTDNNETEQTTDVNTGDEQTTGSNEETEQPSDTVADDQTTSDVKTEQKTEAKTENKTSDASASNDKDSTTSDKKGGCKSAASMGVVALVAIVGSGLATFKKKEY